MLPASCCPQENFMPERKTIERSREDAREGKSPSTQAGEFVREEMHHIREGRHGAASPKQAIAIGLSQARRAGVKLRPPRQGKALAQTTRKAEQDYRKGQSQYTGKPSARRSRATSNALKKKGRSAASHSALSRQAKTAARNRGAASRSTSAKKASSTRKHAKAA